MVLKRLLVTTLGALGLGALVAGPAFGQEAPGSGNIPAPDLFDDQIACSMNVPVLMGMDAVPMPSVVPEDAMTSPLDNLLRGMSGMGDPRNVDLALSDTDGINPMDLIYVVPTGVANCGGPTDGTVAAFTAAVNGAIATHVAEGFTAVKAAYDLLVEQEGEVATAQTALNDARKAATSTNSNTTAINSAQAILDAATTELAKRQTALDAISAGPIYQAGIAEWRARGAVETTVAAWNMAVDGVTNDAMTGALDVLDAASYGGPRHQNADSAVLTGYVSLLDSRTGGEGADPSGTAAGSVGNVLNADGTVNLANLRTYADIGATDGGVRTTDNFNDDGTLRVPMRATLDPDDPATIMEPLPITATIADIRADVEAANNVVKALEEAQAKNQNVNNAIAFEEGLRRARLEAAHLNAQWNAAITDAIDLRTDAQKLRFVDDNGDGDNSPDDNETTPNTAYVDAFSLLSLNTAYQGALAKRDTAESALRMAVSDREAKTRATINSFTSPGSFYQQLVDRRQALKDAASNIVNRIVNAGGTPTTAQNKAVEDAQKALDTANKVKGNYDALVSDENNPAVGLVDELAKTGGDDGQALVSAITGNYDATQANEDRLDALLTTADDGTESGRVKSLEDKVSMLEGGGAGGGVDQLRTDLDALTAMDDPETMENENGAVTQNAVDISKVDGELSKLEETVDDNSADLDTVWDDLFGGQRGVEAQHGDPANCDSTSTRTGDRLNCVEARSRHNEADIEDVEDLLKDKKEYIDNLGAAIGVDPVTGEGTGDDGMSRVDKNAADIDALTAGADTDDMSDDGPITANTNAIVADRKQADMDLANDLGGEGRTTETIKGNADAIAKEVLDRKQADTDLAGDLGGEGRTTETIKGNADAIAKEVLDRAAADKAEMDARMAADKTEMDARMAADKAEMEARMKGDADEAEARMAADKAEMDARMMADTALGGRIDAEAMARSDADMALGMRIDGEAMARADGDVMLATAIEQAVAAGAASDMALGGRISSNADAIASNMNSIGQNRSMINDNRNMIGELSDDLDVVRAGVAASMALAGMPAINGRGIAIGVGSYDGESAFAVGFQIQGEQASFKVGVTSSGGETGASAGVGFNF